MLYSVTAVMVVVAVTVSRIDATCNGFVKDGEVKALDGCSGSDLFGGFERYTCNDAMDAVFVTMYNDTACEILIVNATEVTNATDIVCNQEDCNNVVTLSVYNSNDCSGAEIGEYVYDLVGRSDQCVTEEDHSFQMLSCNSTEAIKLNYNSEDCSGALNSTEYFNTTATCINMDNGVSMTVTSIDCAAVAASTSASSTVRASFAALLVVATVAYSLI
jgi:hypothetical protein